MPNVPALKAEFFKSLGHPVRIRVLELLAEGDRTVGELRAEIAVGQPHLSQQLALLRRAGFIEATREGTSVRYALTDARTADLLALAREMLLDQVTATRDELRMAG